MKNWRSIISVVEVVIIFTCVIVLITYFANKKEKNIDNSSYKVQDKNGIITESYALEYLNKYVDELLFSGYINEKSENYIEKEFDLVTPTIFNNLTDNDKLYLSLSYLDNAKLSLTKDNVIRKYNEYFNTSEIDFKNVIGCSSYTYEKDTEKYIKNNSCINSSLDKLMVYKEKYERDNKIGKATIYVGIKNSNGIYKDINKTNIYETEDIENFAINSDNYTEFSKYIITFKEKDDSLYYFFSIERAN